MRLLIMPLNPENLVSHQNGQPRRTSKLYMTLLCASCGRSVHAVFYVTLESHNIAARLYASTTCAGLEPGIKKKQLSPNNVSSMRDLSEVLSNSPKFPVRGGLIWRRLSELKADRL